MNIFVNGGGCGVQAAEAYARFSRVLPDGKPILYIPFAQDDEDYPSCLEWITGELAFLRRSIDMVTSAEELAAKDFSACCAVFIGGGNTFKLLAELKRCACFAKLAAYIADGGVVFGGSAGAILFGADIGCAIDADPNDVGLTDTRAFDLLGGASLYPHYDADSAEQHRFLTGFSRGCRIIALPEDDTLFIHDGITEHIGVLTVCEYADGVRRELHF